MRLGPPLFDPKDFFPDWHNRFDWLNSSAAQFAQELEANQLRWASYFQPSEAELRLAAEVANQARLSAEVHARVELFAQPSPLVEHAQQTLSSLLDSITQPARGVQGALASLIHRDRELSKTLASMFAHYDLGTIRQNWARFADVYLGSLPPGFEVTESGAFIVGGERVERKKASETLAEFTENVAGASSPEDFFDKLETFAKSLPKPIRWLLYVIVWVASEAAGNLISPIFQNSRPAGPDHVEVSVTINDFRGETHGAERLADYRFVTVRQLRVRADGNLNGAIIGCLVRGQIVREIRVEKRWALVEFRDREASEARQGWACVSYLSRFDLTPRLSPTEARD